NDVINARDGEADSVDCGIGEDRAVVDAIDTVANCEKVEGADSNGGPKGGTGGSKVSVTIGKAKLRSLASKGLTVSVACTAARAAKGTLKVGSRTIAKGSGKAAKAGTAKVKLKASKKAARSLRKLSKARATLKVTVRQAGKSSSISRKLTLKR